MFQQKQKVKININKANEQYLSCFYGKEEVLRFWMSEFPDMSKYIVERKFFPSEFTGSNFEIIVVSNEDFSIELSPEKHVMTISQYIEMLLTESLIMPRKLRIDFSTLCQLDCASCYMRLSNNGTMGQGYLTFNNFKNLIDDNPEIKEIETSNSGELFLNPDFIKILKYAFERKVHLTAYNGVNMNMVTKEQLEALVKYEFRGLVVSIDGGSEEVYKRYRRNGSFKTVLNNIKSLIAYKKQYNSMYPIIRWQYIIMEETEEDIPKAKKMAKELGIPIEFKLTWDKKYAPINIELLKKETGLKIFSRADITEGVYFGFLKCIQMYLSPQLNWDGRLLGCCNLYKEDYGVNAFEIGLKEALKSPRFIAAKRHMLLRKEIVDVDFPCKHCNTNRKMLLSGAKLNIIDTMYSKGERVEAIEYIPYN